MTAGSEDIFPRRPRAKRRISTQAYLLTLVAAVIVPLLIFAGFLLSRYAATERERYEREAIQLARQINLVIEGELTGLIALLRGLASSTALAKSDLAQFHEEARRLVVGRDQIVVLREFSTRQLINTERPYGAELPQSPPLTAEEEADFAAGNARVTDVYPSPISGEPRIAVAFPIALDGKATVLLAITVSASRIRDAMLPAVPEGWVIGVGDRKGKYIARSQRHEEFAGKPGLPEYISQVVGQSGAFTSRNFDGTWLLAGYYRSYFSGWFVTANIPRATIEAPLSRSLTYFATLGIAALALSTALAFLFGVSFTRASSLLAQRAAALGNGEPIQPMDSHLTEFVVVGDALVRAGAAIDERVRERERATAQRRLLVNELNHRVKNTLATVQSIASQTLRSALSTADARTALTDRLMALAKAHDVLTHESWEGADLRHIVTDATAPHGGPDRFSVDGPPVWLSPSLSLAFALALHELATNAAKYGALSIEGGTVAISWELASPEKTLLTLRWIERGGPPVEQPTRRGFGSRLIEQSLSADASGKATIEYMPDGVACTMQAQVGAPRPGPLKN